MLSLSLWLRKMYVALSAILDDVVVVELFHSHILLCILPPPTPVKALQQIRNVAKLFAHLHRLIRVS